MSKKEVFGKEEKEEFVAEVRRTFFNFLKPFLISLPEFFKDSSHLTDQEIVFSKYFDSKTYLESFDG